MSERVVVTGGAGAIGSAIAAAFLDGGADVELVDRADAVHEVAARLGCRAHQADVTDEQALEGLAGTGPLRCLVNAAGCWPITPFAELDAKTWRAVLDSNLTASMLVTRVLLDDLRAAQGSVVNITSATAFSGGPPGLAAYVTAKAGLRRRGVPRIARCSLGHRSGARRRRREHSPLTGVQMQRAADMFKLDGRVAVVTGAGSGLGREFASVLAESGACVACLDVEPEWLDETVGAIHDAGGTALGVGCDVADALSVEQAVAETVARLGRIDVLVNNAGITAPACRTHEVSIEEWDRVLGVNLRGTFLSAPALSSRRCSPGGTGRSSTWLRSAAGAASLPRLPRCPTTPRRRPG